MLQGQKRQDEVLSDGKKLVLKQIGQAQQQVIASGSISGVFQATSGLERSEKMSLWHAFCSFIPWSVFSGAEGG
jgi:hypothetical protein